MTTPDPQTLLISVYRQAYYQVVKLLIAAAAVDRSVGYYRAILADIDGILSGLDPAAQKWIQANIPQAYRAGMGDAVSGLSAAGVATPLSVSPMIGIHRSAVEILANNLFGDLTASSQFMGRQVNDLFRQAGISEALSKVSTGNTVRGASKNLKAALQSRGVTAFQDSAGKQWRLDSYASMAIRSTTREATNRGTLNQLSSLGYDLVTIPPHFPTCELCAPYQGRVYSITGKDKRFPRLWLTVFVGGYANIHPNCSHVVTPYIADLADDLAGDVERSNQPFDVDPRSEAERQAFANGQATKRQANADRRQWEQYKTRMPDDTPGFAQFRRIKNADGAAWDKLQGKYRSAGREAPKSLADVLKEKETEIQPQRYETAAVYAPDGTLVFEKPGQQYSVEFTAEEVAKMSGNILTHNHPMGWQYPASDPLHAGNSFSKADMNIAASKNLAEIRAVTPTTVYSMSAPGGGWPVRDDWYAIISRFDAQVRTEYQAAIDNGTMSPLDAEINHWDAVAQRFADAWGARYTKGPFR